MRLNRRRFVLGLGALAALPRRAFGQARSVAIATYAHIDPAWRWPLQEGLEQSDSTFRSVLRVLDTFPNLRFSETSASYYHWVRRTDPPTFARILAAVRGKRWEPVGGWWTEADVNIVSGESLMRQAWYGRREFREHLGYTTRVAMLPDSFGSSANLPAILRASGFDYYVSGRGTFGDGPLPQGTFFWQSLGTSKILAYNNPVPGGEDDAIKGVKAAIALPFSYAPLIWFGLGDHGGGPTIDALQALQAYLGQPGAPHVTFSTIEEYLRHLPRPSIVKQGEIEGVFPGAFTNAYEIKRSNIRAERTLIDCERFDVLASLLGAASDPPQLDDLWHTLLLNQHHDTISGTSTRANSEHTVAQNDAVAERASDFSMMSLARIVDRIPHSADDQAMVVAFNPLPYPVATTLAYPFAADPGRMPKLIDAYGRNVDVQPAFAEGPVYAGRAPATLFSATLPAFGYAAFRMTGYQEAYAAPARTGVTSLRCGATTISFDERSGMPASIVAANATVALPNARFTVFHDAEDTWGGNELRADAAGETGTFSLVEASLLEDGPVRAIALGRFAYKSSTADVRYELSNDERILRIELDVDWREPFARLAFAIDVPGESAWCDIPFGAIERSASTSIRPGISLCARPSGVKQLAILSHGNHGFWASAQTMGVTLLRSTPFSALDRVDPSATSFLDSGRHRIAIAVALADDLPELLRMAESFERPFPVLWNGVHDGRLPLAAQFASIDASTIVASVRRVDGTVEARLHNVTPRSTNASGTIGSFPFATPLDGYGIATLRLSGKSFHAFAPK